MVAVSPKPSDLARKLLQAFLGRLRAFGLQPALMLESPLLYLLPVVRAIVNTFGVSGRFSNPKVNANHLTGEFGLLDRLRDRNVHPPVSFSVPDQVSSCGVPATVLEVAGGKSKAKPYTATDGENGEFSSLEPSSKASGVIPNGARGGFRAARFLTIFLETFRSLERLCCLYSRRTSKLGWQSGQLAMSMVSCIMKRNAVGDIVHPAKTAGLVKRPCIHLDRLGEKLRNASIRLKPKSNGSIRLHGSYIATIENGLQTYVRLKFGGSFLVILHANWLQTTAVNRLALE